MRNRIVLLLMTVLLAVCGVWLVGCKPAGEGDGTQAKQKYHCPMHPTVVQDRKGSCPICGMDLVPIKADKGSAKAAAPAEDDKTAQVKAGQFYCPMAAEHVQDEPGKCPKCGVPRRFQWISDREGGVFQRRNRAS